MNRRQRRKETEKKQKRGEENSILVGSERFLLRRYAKAQHAHGKQPMSARDLTSLHLMMGYKTEKQRLLQAEASGVIPRPALNDSPGDLCPSGLPSATFH